MPPKRSISAVYNPDPAPSAQSTRRFPQATPAVAPPQDTESIAATSRFSKASDDFDVSPPPDTDDGYEYYGDSVGVLAWSIARCMLTCRIQEDEEDRDSEFAPDKRFPSESHDRLGLKRKDNDKVFFSENEQLRLPPSYADCHSRARLLPRRLWPSIRPLRCYARRTSVTLPATGAPG